MTALLVRNVVLFQLGWFACVLGGAYDYPVAGTAVVIVIVSMHLLTASNVKAEVQLILLVLLIGSVWDSLLTYMQIYHFETGTFIQGVAPYWIMAMWALFATTLNVSLYWMKNRWLLAVIFGMIGGPLAYFAGFKLGAVEFNNSLLISMGLIGAGWAVIMPLLMSLSNRYNGYQSVGAV